MKNLFQKGMMFMESILKMTCKDVYPYISEELDREIAFIPRMKVKFHLALCKVCSYYQRQLVTIKMFSEKLGFAQSELKEGPELSDEKKQKIKESLKKGK